MEQNRGRGQEINSHLYGQFMTKEARIYNKGKSASSKVMVMGKLDSFKQKKQTVLLSQTR